MVSARRAWSRNARRDGCFRVWHEPDEKRRPLRNVICLRTGENMSGKVNVIAAVGLALGGALGMAGAMVTQQNVQAILWAIDGAGLVMATALLAMKYFRMGNDIVASGFLVFAIGEGVILLSGPAAGLAGSVPAFAAGTALWGTALLLVSIPKLFALPVRLLGIVSAALFIITSARIFWGEQLLPTSTPLPTYAYPLLVATFVGWIWTLWREPD
jgi:hypothetical protein